MANTNQNSSGQNREILQWHALEFEHHEKGIGWYVTFAAIAIMLVAYYLFTRDYFGAFFWVFLSVAAYLYARRKPGEVLITLSKKGVTVGEEFFPYTQLKKFWIVDKQYSRSIHLETTAYLNRVIVILMHDEINVEDVHKFLAAHLPEGNHDEETVTEIIARILRF